jgi:basic amino acid/polyamine antiporter, APA family
MTAIATPPTPRLERRLGALDGALITIGAVVGTGIFLTAGDVARAAPHPALILAVWAAGGLLAVAGALTYAELGALFPRAGGIYHYLAEAYGPLWGFLYGWTCFLVIMSGGIAAIAVGFGEYLGSFVPQLSSARVVLDASLGGWTWRVSGAQAAAVLAILALTAVNHFGVRQGANLQNAITWLKVAVVAGFAILALVVTAPPHAGAAPLTGAGWAGLAPAMIAALWTYDGWYGLTFSAGEMRDPARELPRAIVAGTIAVMVLYLLMNLAYLRATPVSVLAASPRSAETAAAALFGASGARAMALAVVVSSFGCLAATILYSSRLYQPMAQDGVFLESLATIHPRWRTPVASLWAQSAWAMVLALSGTYAQLYTSVVFAGLLFHVAGGVAVFRLRRARPELPRPYRVWGYPAVPLLFIGSMVLLSAATLASGSVPALAGLALTLLGVPVYLVWRRRPRSAAGAGPPGDRTAAPP